MTTAQHQAMEASLETISIDVTPIVFERFFATYPQQKGNFYVPEVSCGRMVNESVSILLGLAADERWAPPAIENFMGLHRANYDPISLSEYGRFLDLLVDVLAEVAGSDWTEAAEAAWREQAERFKAHIAAELERGLAQTAGFRP